MLHFSSHIILDVFWPEFYSEVSLRLRMNLLVAISSWLSESYHSLNITVGFWTLRIEERGDGGNKNMDSKADS